MGGGGGEEGKERRRTGGRRKKTMSKIQYDNGNAFYLPGLLDFEIY